MPQSEVRETGGMMFNPQWFRSIWRSWVAKKNRDLQDDSQPVQTNVTDAGLESLNLSVHAEPEWEYFPGYCLEKMELVKFSYPARVMGGLYWCPHCGPITERYDDPERGHIFEPSARLVRLLEKSKECAGEAK